MKITNIYDRMANGFSFDAECEFCKAVQREMRGAATEKWNKEILPTIRCRNCGRTAAEWDKTQKKDHE